VYQDDSEAAEERAAAMASTMQQLKALEQRAKRVNSTAAGNESAAESAPLSSSAAGPLR